MAKLLIKSEDQTALAWALLHCLQAVIANPSVPQFPSLKNGDDDGTYLSGLFWLLSELIVESVQNNVLHVVNTQHY